MERKIPPEFFTVLTTNALPDNSNGVQFGFQKGNKKILHPYYWGPRRAALGQGHGAGTKVLAQTKAHRISERRKEMKRDSCRAEPGYPTEKQRGPRGLDAPAAPRQEERNTLLAFSYGNPSGDGLTTVVDDGLRQSTADAVSYEVEVDPGDYFKKVVLTVEPDPHTGEQRRFILDMVWGRWYRPPEGAGAGVPAPNRPPVLTGGATVEVETPTMTT